MARFEKVSPQVKFPQVEHEVLEFWDREEVFQKSLDQRQDADEYVFYDGPPFATGLPHYGHLLAGTIKDVVPRYQTMRGHYVSRTFGWDCHGLPVENEVEKDLELKSKKDIEAFGVDKFNEACRSIVLKYTNEWESIVRRMGRWVDFRNGYKTMDRDYMESIWWVFKQLWDKDLVYEGHKIMWYCPRCATPLSNFEVNQGYHDVEDPAITVRFADTERENTYYLAWTTTPWTLPGNLALTVGPEVQYVEVDDDGTHYILAEAQVKQYWRKEQPPVVARYTGAELVGRTYTPLFPYFAELAEEGAFRIIDADFVSTESGTGIVHTAPGFGEDDALAGKAHGIPSVCPLDMEGQYTAEVTDYAGRYVKGCDDEIIRGLKAEGKLVHRTQYKHSYPHCWRCDNPLLNRAISTWFVGVEQIKDKMLAANAQIHWVPGHIKGGRFGKWLEGARDWAISRNRYWGCPLPIWRNEETGETIVVGSVAELEELCGQEVTDIHKHFVDPIELTGKDGAKLTRVPEVLDCWFESGSMPYAQRHFPFEGADQLDKCFPADFIAEGQDQTRGWFYTLVVLGAALFDQPAFKNCVVNGMVLASDGEKMSKRKKNYPDPVYMMETYGADAIRLYMLNSPVMHSDDLRFSERRTDTDPDGVQETMRAVLIPLWNAYNFFVTYAIEDDWDPAANPLPETLDNPLDQWILSQCSVLIDTVRTSMDRYDLQAATACFAGFIDNLTNWYIRRSRRRFWKSESDTDKNQAYATLYHVLLTCAKTAAPFTPFITEAIYRNLRTDDMPISVHLCDYPAAEEQYHDEALDRRMALAQTAVSLGRNLRRSHKTRVRQPLRSATLVSLDATTRDDLAAMASIVKEELNVREVLVESDEERLVILSAKPNFPKLGPKLGPKMRFAAKAIGSLDADALRTLRHGGEVTIDLDGESFTITEDDIELRREEKPDTAVANEGAVTVALDLALDDDLQREGQARELVHVIQNLRKEAGLDVSDRIVVRHNLGGGLELALASHQPYIANETLAVRFETLTGAEGVAPVKVGDDEATLVVERAAT